MLRLTFLFLFLFYGIVSMACQKLHDIFSTASRESLIFITAVVFPIAQ